MHRFLSSGVEAAAWLEEKAPSIVISDTNLTRDGLDVSFSALRVRRGWEDEKKAHTLFSTTSHYDHVWLQPQPVRSVLPSTDRKCTSLRKIHI